MLQDQAAMAQSSPPVEREREQATGPYQVREFKRCSVTLATITDQASVAVLTPW